MCKWLGLLTSMVTFAGVANAAIHAHGAKEFGRYSSWWFPVCDWTILSAAE